MFKTRRPSKTSSLLLSALLAAPLAAQSAGTAPPPPTVEVTGSGEAKVTPDRALVYVGVQTKGRTAALAGQENARLATAILDAVRTAGIARGSGFSNRGYDGTHGDIADDTALYLG